MVTVTWMTGGVVQQTQVVDETPADLYALMLRQRVDFLAADLAFSEKWGMTYNLWKADHFAETVRRSWGLFPSWWADLCGRMLAEAREAAK